ncbi:hypothetical protein FQN52_005350 [Onygenales sp. PD_12]|nr:hypothetical protein FQN52_005350 [Onygenales sp. PD_12]
MSQYIPAFLAEPILRRTRQLQESLADPPLANAESYEPGTRDGGPLAPSISADMSRSDYPPAENPPPYRNDYLAALADLSISSPHGERPDRSIHEQDTASGDLMRSRPRSSHLAEDEHVGLAAAPLLPDSENASRSSFRQRRGSSSSNGSVTAMVEDASGGIGTENTLLGQPISWDRLHASKLPEDDGMAALREKIHSIRDSRAPNEEKARLIHGLMTEKYTSSLKKSRSQSFQPRSPSSLQGQDRPWTPASPSKRSSTQCSLTPSSATSVSSLGFPYYLTEEDLRPTYAPRNESGDDFISSSKELQDDDAVDEDCLQLGCEHYKRRVKLQCYTCKKWYTCRFCHNEEEDHELVRSATENMLCMVCSSPQPAAQWCRKCGVQAASYYCSVCKLWDNDSQKSIYHCSDCGICRIGQGIGKDYYHCKTCSVCIPISIEKTHRCIERSTQCDCPICGEYMFTSPEAVIFMRCGHSIHQKCFSEHSKTSYRCPICSKTISNMIAHFRNLDRAIEDQPMPEDFRDTRALISCNDCSAKSSTRYHWLGLRCEICDSYNTNQIRLYQLTDDQTNETLDTLNNRAIPISTSRTLQPPDENRPASESAMPSTISRSVPADDVSFRLTPLSTDETSSFRRSFSTMPYPRNIRSTSPTVGNYFGLHRRSDSGRSTMESHVEDSKNDNNGAGFWGSKASRSRFGIFGDGADDDEMVVVDDESESDDDSDENDEELEDDEDEDEDDEDDIDIFGHR